VFIKALTNRGYSVLTINVYGWILCTLGGLVLWGFSPAAPGLSGGQNILLTVGLIVVSGVCPALLYSYGLQKEEAGKGAVMASVEPVMASVMGFVAFHETPTALGLLGIVLVLAAVVILNTGAKPEALSSPREQTMGQEGSLKP
jgi:drug/metabolite transporter (DMT)-like permease